MNSIDHEVNEDEISEMLIGFSSKDINEIKAHLTLLEEGVKSCCGHLCDTRPQMMDSINKLRKVFIP